MLGTCCDVARAWRCILRFKLIFTSMLLEIFLGGLVFVNLQGLKISNTTGNNRLQGSISSITDTLNLSLWKSLILSEFHWFELRVKGWYSRTSLLDPRPYPRREPAYGCYGDRPRHGRRWSVPIACSRRFMAWTGLGSSKDVLKYHPQSV